MSIAEQMGRTLQRTAISTNIKERLDFSCALFGVCYLLVVLLSQGSNERFSERSSLLLLSISLA